jgi:hypothetical protein
LVLVLVDQDIAARLGFGIAGIPIQIGEVAGARISNRFAGLVKKGDASVYGPIGDALSLRGIRQPSLDVEQTRPKTILL